MKRILFVDDEEAILRSLRNLLRKQRTAWDMVFACGAEPALAELEKAPFDVVVSDIRMPGMDGVALLDRVRHSSPASVRIILSGFAERDVVLKGVTVAHQLLGKPCESERLRGTVERACALQDVLHDPELRGCAGGLDALPSPPGLYRELMAAAANPDVALADIAAIVERDPAMSAKILQVVSSPYFGVAGKHPSVAIAVQRLGLELVRALVLFSHGVGAAGDLASVDGFSIARLQERSLAAAQLARALAGRSAPAAEAFTAALLADLGQVILATRRPQRFSEILREASGSRRPVHVVEAEILGVTHADVGAYLLGAWGLPQSLVEAVAYHHRPSAAPADVADLATLLHVATALSDPAGGEALLDPELMARPEIAARLPDWKRAAEGQANGRA
ncbi:MAG: HDOD domain-containing protein [Deltaproteobacteria bacterium]|nr:HDOD domain-containing protein [Deltaproteobacteria bacterium]